VYVYTATHVNVQLLAHTLRTCNSATCCVIGDDDRTASCRCDTTLECDQ